MELKPIRTKREYQAALAEVLIKPCQLRRETGELAA